MATAIREPVGELKIEISKEGLQEKSINGVLSIPFSFDVIYSFSLVPPHIRF